jgi:drug/metabolite transporter (DMT)-like permease
MTPAWLWVVFTILAASGQTARNAMQRELTASLRAVGATHVRFLFGFPFAILFLGIAMLATHQSLPHPGAMFWAWDLTGAISQILATALMLLTMEERSFVVAIAYIKTEPVFVAILGLVFLGDLLSLPMMLAIVIATAGVVLISLAPRGAIFDRRTALLGLGSGGLFAISAIGYRGAILSLNMHDYLMSATFTLAIGLVTQAALLTAYLAIRQPQVLAAIIKLWRPSFFAGFMGALASEMWFLAFALASAASVRTLGLVDVVFAQAVSRFVFKHKTTTREYAGIGLLLAGAILLVAVQR